MKTIRTLLVVSVMMFTQLTVQAQSESTNQLGLRFGGFSGIEFRHIGGRNVGVNVDLMERYPFGLGMLEVLAEKNFVLKNSNGFILYVGAGGFVAGNGRRAYYYNDPPPFRDRDYYYYRSPIFGVTGVGGIDYYIPRSPIVIGLDIRPRISFYGYYPWDAGLSGRFIF